ncbi:hypothetical protein QFC20_003385 [Naganishia adeliensis]|uniref:Uncharacterized protein n=1 Tax=Naganishia adeliensis TaxID=92952 RepID=A0ACC2WBB5_9TREE|nr:hypothetical protein QFC20_003385 [Naganishia adeliensis]
MYLASPLPNPRKQHKNTISSPPLPFVCVRYTLSSGLGHAQRMNAEKDIIPPQNRPPPQSTTLRQPISKPPTPINQRKILPGIRRNNNNRPSPSTPSTDAGPSRQDTTHQARGPPGDVERWEDAFRIEYAGMTDDQVFKRVSRPPGIPGLEEWGIPPPTGEAPSPALQAKVGNVLRLKVEEDRHINTTLLSSTAFANPHIYSKLVEFVDIDERGSAFPGGGWITRRNLESRIPVWGAKALAAQQKAQETALQVSQSTGKRKTIDFTSSSRKHEASSSARRKDDRYSVPLPRNGSGESRRERSVNGDGSRRRDTGSLGEGQGRRNVERDGKRREKERRWD